MLTILHVPGIQYSGETTAQMAERDRRAAEWNAYVAAVHAWYEADSLRPWWIEATTPMPQSPAWVDSGSQPSALSPQLSTP
jgi:hypothetical protein